MDRANWESAIDLIPASGGIAYGNGLFLISFPSSGSGLFFASLDGKNWSPHYTPTNVSSVLDLAYNDGTFVSVGTFGRISQSDPLVRLNVTYDGLAHLTLEEPKNGTYRIEATDSLVGTNAWQALTALSTPPYSWSDPQSGGVSNRFYRAVMLP